jgi:hypothetical protein
MSAVITDGWKRMSFDSSGAYETAGENARRAKKSTNDFIYRILQSPVIDFIVIPRFVLFLHLYFIRIAGIWSSLAAKKGLRDESSLRRPILRANDLKRTSNQFFGQIRSIPASISSDYSIIPFCLTMYTTLLESSQLSASA